MLQRLNLSQAGHRVLAACAAIVLIAGSHASTPAVAQTTVRRVHAPYFGTDPITDHEHETGVFWFGRVTPTDNYVDVRVAYNRDGILLQANVFDRRIWHDTDSTRTAFEQLTQWDSVVFYVHTSPQAGNTPASATYRIVGQLNWPNDLRKFSAVAKGNGSGWTDLGRSLTMTLEGAWRGAGPNNDSDNRGWFERFSIPFSSLGLSGPPAPGAVWRLGVQLFDRDIKAGAIGAPKIWPEGLQPNAPSTWGQLVFGLPSILRAPIKPSTTITIGNGIPGSGGVVDAMVGGSSVCADPFAADYFTGFGTANYARSDFFNIQNQSDVADWPCFSKYYITVPLTALPSSFVVMSATLTAVQFGNAGQGIPPQPYSSLIQVFTVADDWKEDQINWNNAPLAVENVTRARALPLRPSPLPAIPVSWDVTGAVDEAYRAGKPLRLALYSADSAQNSGKYFWTSDMADASLRPTLVVTLGTAIAPVDLKFRTYLPICLRP